jgi:hypothetical protein
MYLKTTNKKQQSGGNFAAFFFYLQVVFQVVGDGKQWEAPQSLSEVA